MVWISQLQTVPGVVQYPCCPLYGPTYPAANRNETTLASCCPCRSGHPQSTSKPVPVWYLPAQERSQATECRLPRTWRCGTGGLGSAVGVPVRAGPRGVSTAPIQSRPPKKHPRSAPDGPKHTLNSHRGIPLSRRVDGPPRSAAAPSGPVYGVGADQRTASRRNRVRKMMGGVMCWQIARSCRVAQVRSPTATSSWADHPRRRMHGLGRA
jgi:hypothetical protein